MKQESGNPDNVREAQDTEPRRKASFHVPGTQTRSKQAFPCLAHARPASSHDLRSGIQGGHCDGRDEGSELLQHAGAPEFRSGGGHEAHRPGTEGPGQEESRAAGFDEGMEQGSSKEAAGTSNTWWATLHQWNMETFGYTYANGKEEDRRR